MLNPCSDFFMNRSRKRWQWPWGTDDVNEPISSLGRCLRALCRPLPPSGRKRTKTKKDRTHLNPTIWKLWCSISFHLIKNFCLGNQIWFGITLYSRFFLRLINFHVFPLKNFMISSWYAFLFEAIPLFNYWKWANKTKSDASSITKTLY